jgi:hypothetical protein
MISYITGVMSVLLAYALFSSSTEEEDISEPEFVVNGVPNRLREFSCQTCRKLKNHREVELGVWECVKCHRRIYTR